MRLSTSQVQEEMQIPTALSQRIRNTPVPPITSPSRPSHEIKLTFSNLSFTYPGVTNPALKNITFEFFLGKSLVIVGPNGAGKSTILDLLLRFWEYQEGYILLGEHPLCDYHPNIRRALFTVVSQKNYFFSTSSKDNLLIAYQNADQVEIEKVAKQAKIPEFINQLPQGYNTFIGEQG